MNNTINYVTPIIGSVGLVLMILASIAVLIYYKKTPITLGKLKVSFSKKGTVNFIAICVLPFLLPVSCFFRNWSPFIAVLFSIFAVATVSFGLKELFRLKQRGIYENGFIIGGSTFLKAEIDFVDFIKQSTNVSGDSTAGFVKIQTKDRKIVQEIVDTSEDFEKITQAVKEWGLPSSKE